MRIPLASSVARAVAGARRFPGAAWLDGDGRASGGRMSFVACAPVETIRVAHADGTTMADVARALDTSRTESTESTRPRWIGYLAYDLGERCDGGSRPNGRSLPLPAGRGEGWERGDGTTSPDASSLAHWSRYDAVACFDHATRDAWIDADGARAANALLDRLTSRDGPRHCPLESPVFEGEPRIDSDVDRAAHMANVEVALGHIAAGDVYQVNVTRRITVRGAGDAFSLARRMRRASPVPYGAWIDAGGHAIVGRSPELFLRWDRARRELVTMPIKGTLAHAPGRTFDQSSVHLRGDPKEHAEHVMIVDMARNDLGRIAVTGSVRVHPFLAVERFAELDHLVSTVRCETRPDVDLARVLDATFPGASITGAPKIAAMRLIARIERSRRGLYTGAYGYVACDGSIVLAMAIRTAVVARDALVYGTGGGIVAASNPAREWDETELKARVLRAGLARSKHAGGAHEQVEDGRLVHTETPAR